MGFGGQFELSALLAIAYLCSEISLARFGRKFWLCVETEFIGILETGKMSWIGGL